MRPVETCAARLSPVKRRLLVTTPSRRVASAAVAGLAVTALTGLTSGCMIFNPVQTDIPYVPGDGVQADVGQLAVRDLALIGDGSGRAVVSGSVINRGSQPMTVQLALSSGDGAAPIGGVKVQLANREQLALATRRLVLDSVPAKPGSVVSMSVTAEPGGTTIVTVPVLPATDYFATVTPSGAPTATSTAASPATPTTTPTTSAP